MAAQPQTAAHARRRVTARELTAFVPSLDPSLYKGQAGKIGVIGGSRDYTGAPYYAGITGIGPVRGARIGEGVAWCLVC